MPRETIRVHVHSSSQEALHELQRDSSMVGDVFEVPSEAVIGVAVTPKRIFALTVGTGAFTQADTAEQVVLLRSFPAYRVARALIAYEPERYTWEGA